MITKGGSRDGAGPQIYYFVIIHILNEAVIEKRNWNSTNNPQILSQWESWWYLGLKVRSFWKFSTVFIIVFLCILRNNFTKAAVPLLSKFSKHRSNSSNKLCMKRWHCIVSSIQLSRKIHWKDILFSTFVYIYVISLLLLIQSMRSSRKWNCTTDVLP